LPSGLLPPVIQWGQGGQQPPATFAATIGFSSPAAFLLWNGLSSSTSLLKCNLATLKLWHIDFGLDTATFNSEHLTCVARAQLQDVLATFCLTFACFLCTGKFTWEAQDDSSALTVGSVSFASDSLFATIHLPSSKMDPFQQGAMLTAPAHCGIELLAYSGHLFRRGAATWAAANSVDDDTIHALGRWHLDALQLPLATGTPIAE
ncbi:hypothetical protein, partial [Sporisorium scitamineum]